MTFAQVTRRGRTRVVRRYNRSPKMAGHPQRVGVVTRVGTTKPKKPNSAIRKIAKVFLPDGRNVRASIVGSGHSLQEHNTVLVRAGRVRDVPGVHYKLIRNQLDFDPPTGFRRHSRRSKFGVINWAFLFRTPTNEPERVVCRLRSRRNQLENEWSLPTTWVAPGFPRAAPPGVTPVDRRRRRRRPG